MTDETVLMADSKMQQCKKFNTKFQCSQHKDNINGYTEGCNLKI